MLSPSVVCSATVAILAVVLTLGVAYRSKAELMTEPCVGNKSAVEFEEVDAAIDPDQWELWPHCGTMEP